MDWQTLLTAFALGVTASVIGGSVAGVLIGGKYLSNGLAALMGGFFGPLAGVAGVALGLTASHFLFVS